MSKLKSPYLPYFFFHFIYILGVSFTKTTFVPYLKTKGIVGADLHTALAIFSATVILAEIPLLGINLKLGPFRSFLLGSAFKLLTAICFIFGTTQWHFYFAEFLSGIAVCLISGSLDAWLMSQIDQNNETSNSKKLPIFAFAERLDKLALAIGGSSGALLASLDISYSWYGVGTIFLIVLTFGVFFYFSKNTYQPKKATLPNNTITHTFDFIIKIKTVLGHVFKNPNFLYISLHSFFISLALSSPKMLWIPILKENFGRDFIFISKMWLLLCGIQFLGTFGVKKLAPKIKNPVLFKIYLSVISSVILIGIISSQNEIIAFMICFFLIEAIQPYHQVATQGVTFDNGNEEERISALSSFSAFSKIGNAAGLSISAFLFSKFEGSGNSHTLANTKVWGLLSVGYLLLTVLSYFYFNQKSYSKK